MSQAIKFEDSAAAERAELERLRTALEASGDVVYEWRLTSDAIEWSTNARQAFGLNESIDISTHANFLTRICSEDLPGLTRPHDDHVTGGESFLAEYPPIIVEGTMEPPTPPLLWWTPIFAHLHAERT